MTIPRHELHASMQRLRSFIQFAQFDPHQSNPHLKDLERIEKALDLEDLTFGEKVMMHLPEGWVIRESSCNGKPAWAVWTPKAPPEPYWYTPFVYIYENDSPERTAEALQVLAVGQQ